MVSLGIILVLLFLLEETAEERLMIPEDLIEGVLLGGKMWYAVWRDTFGPYGPDKKERKN